MKLSIAILLAAESALLAQGLVNFNNTSTTLVSTQLRQGGSAPISGPSGSYYFALLTAPVGTFDLSAFTFTGIYATNLSQSGLFDGGTVAVPGWTPGTARSYFIEGWSSQMGHDWQPSWLLQGNALGSFGASGLGSGIAGGFNGTTDIPPLELFTAPPGLATGFNLYLPALVPEPSVMTLGLIGFAAIVAARNGRSHTDGQDQVR